MQYTEVYFGLTVKESGGELEAHGYGEMTMLEVVIWCEKSRQEHVSES